MQEQTVRQLQQKMKTQPRKALVLAVSSGKGGVGKSNIAANLAICLAASDKKVTVLDADWGLANLDVIMGINSKYNISHVIKGHKSLNEVVHTSEAGVEVICGVSGLESVANLDKFQRHRLVDELETLAYENDVIIVDTAAGIHKSVIGFCQAADHTLLVTTPEPTAMTDVYAMIKVLALNGYEGRISLAVNMAGSVAQGRKAYHQIADVARKFLDIEIQEAAVLLKDERLCSAVRQRRPVVLAYPNSPITSSFVAMAARLGRSTAAKPDSSGFFRKVVNWLF